jgi:hypothetical protein
LEHDSGKDLDKIIAKFYPDISEEKHEELRKRIDRGITIALPAMQKAEGIVDRWQGVTRGALPVITVAVLSGFMASMGVKLMEIYHAPDLLYLVIFVVFIAFMIALVILLTRWFKESTKAFVFGYMFAEAVEEPLEADSNK